MRILGAILVLPLGVFLVIVLGKMAIAIFALLIGVGFLAILVRLVIAVLVAIGGVILGDADLPSPVVFFIGLIVFVSWIAAILSLIVTLAH